MERILKNLINDPSKIIAIDTVPTKEGFICYIDGVEYITSSAIRSYVLNSPGFSSLSQSDKFKRILGSLMALLPQ